MRRLACGERPGWRAIAEAAGFAFHTIDGAPYWDESHAYAFSLREIEEDIEAPGAELHALCLDFAAAAVADERILASLRIPEAAWDAVRASWQRGDPSLYGRLDFSYGGTGPAKLLEYNADTPTALYESAVFQWHWLEQGLRDGRLGAGSDQFNAIHERLIARLTEIVPPGLTAFAADTSGPEDLGTVAYLQDCAVQAGRETLLLDLAQIGLRADGAFCGPDERPFATLFKLYPWEWAFHDAFGAAVATSSTRFLEPPAGLFRGGPGLRQLERRPCAQAAALARGRQCRDLLGGGRPHRRGGGALRRRGLHPAGAGGAAVLRRAAPAGRRLDRRRCTGRPLHP